MISLEERKKRLRAYDAVAQAKKKGILIPQPCIACGDKAEAHHPDYDKPLDVIWLCRSHHRAADSIRMPVEKVFKSKIPGNRDLVI